MFNFKMYFNFASHFSAIDLHFDLLWLDNTISMVLIFKCIKTYFYAIGYGLFWQIFHVH